MVWGDPDGGDYQRGIMLDVLPGVGDQLVLRLRYSIPRYGAVDQVIELHPTYPNLGGVRW